MHDPNATSPAAPKIVLWIALGLLVGGALLLSAERGSAILLDLAAMTRGLFCL